MIFSHLKREMHFCIALSVLLSGIFGAAWALDIGSYDAVSEEKEVAGVAGRVATLQQDPPTVIFKLLAIEGDFDHTPMHSAVQLIQNLTVYNNWQNTSGYAAYIHLLSNENYTQSSPGTELETIWKQYCRGLPNRVNIMSEIINFLNQTSPGEDPNYTIRILYYIGHTTPQQGPTRTILGITPASGYGIVFDWELDKLLHPSQGPLSDSNSTLVILDTCLSGGYIKNITRSGTVVLAATCPIQNATGWMNATSQCLMPGYWGWFTGHTNASYSNCTNFGPLGVIGTIRCKPLQTSMGPIWSTDRNRDGWGSAAEIFNFSSQTTYKYSYGQYRINRKFKTQLPQRGYGVLGGQTPLVQYNSSASFPGIPSAITPDTTLQTKPPIAEGVTETPELEMVDNPWTMFGNCPAHKSFSAVTGPTISESLWTYDLLIPVTSSPATAPEGIAFTVNEDGEVHAVDFRNGEPVWTLRLNAPVFSFPAFANGIVFVATLRGNNPSGRLYAINAYTGKPRWMLEFPPDTEAFASPAVAGETVYIATIGPPGSQTGVFALNKFIGQVRWFHPTYAPIYSSPAVADGMVFFARKWDGTSMAYICALNDTDGNQIWDYPLAETILISSPAVSNGRVYIGVKGGIGNPPQVLALNEITGAFEWNFLTSAPVSSSPAVDSSRNMVIAASEDGRVYALSAENGNSIWETPPGLVGPINMSSPAISANSLIYIGSIDGRLYCLNETNGQRVWSYPAAGEIISSPALTQEHVLFASKDGNLYCLGPPFPVHDIAASSLQVHPTMIIQGERVSINYTVTNLGNRIETFNVTIAYNTTTLWTPPEYNQPTIIHIREVTLQPGENASQNYEWQTSGIKPGKYTILIIAGLVNYESDPLNNAYLNGKIEIYKGPPVGGICVPVDKFGLLAPYIGLASTILAAIVATAVYVKRRKRKQ